MFDYVEFTRILKHGAKEIKLFVKDLMGHNSFSFILTAISINIITFKCIIHVDY